MGTLFLLTDAQVPNEKFLVLINDLLALMETVCCWRTLGRVWTQYVLDPLLGRLTIKRGKYIKIGDKEVEYSSRLRFILQVTITDHFDMYCVIPLMSFFLLGLPCTYMRQIVCIFT